MSSDNEQIVAMKYRAEAVKLLNNGESIENVADILGMSECIIKYWSETMTGNIPSKSRMANKSESINSSENDNQSKQSHINSPIYSKLVKKETRGYSHISLQDKLVAIEMYKNGSTLTSIALKYQTSLGLVRNWVKTEKVIRDKFKKMHIVKENNFEDKTEKYRSKNDAIVESRKRIKLPIGKEYCSKIENGDCLSNSKRIKIIDEQKNSDSNCDDMYKDFLLKEYKNVKEIYERYIEMSTNLLTMKRNHHDQSSIGAKKHNNILNDHMNFMRSDYFQSISKRYFEMEQMFSNN